MLHIHPDYLPEEVKKVAELDPKRSCRSAQKAMSAYLLRLRALNGSYDFDFGWINKRIALLPGEKLEQFFVALGLLINSEFLRQIIKGGDLRAIKKLLEPAHYDFALNNPLSLIVKGSTFRAFRAPPPEGGEWHRWIREIGDAGLKLSAYIFRRQSQAFADRLCLKLAKEKSALYKQASQELPDCKPSLAEAVFSHTLKEIASEDLQNLTNRPN